MLYKNIFIAFFRSGMLGYGGGLSAIPLMQNEVVDNFKWMDDDEFSDILALANTLPGPINTKLAGYIGWRLARWPGMLVALFAAVAPTLILMILLLTVLNAYKDKSWVQGMAKGVIPVAGVMIGVLAIDFIKSSTRLMGHIVTIILTVVSLLLMQLFNIHPAIIITIIIVASLLSKDKLMTDEEAERVDKS